MKYQKCIKVDFSRQKIRFDFNNSHQNLLNIWIFAPKMTLCNFHHFFRYLTFRAKNQIMEFSPFILKKNRKSTFPDNKCYSDNGQKLWLCLSVYLWILLKMKCKTFFWPIFNNFSWLTCFGIYFAKRWSLKSWSENFRKLASSP